jgi:hypothetical protein
MKTCSNKGCQEVNPQPLTNFFKRKDTKAGLKSRCKKCLTEDIRNYRKTSKGKEVERTATKKWRSTLRGKKSLMFSNLRYHYGINKRTYLEMEKQQNGLCLICKSPPPINRRLYVDHDHTTKVVRGLLCSNCNVGIGYFKNDIILLNSAISYLQKTFGG